jgi:hypothetical protein
MTNNAIYQRKVTTFRSRMQSQVLISYSAMVQDPMFLNDPTKLIDSGSTVTKKHWIRLVRTRRPEEDYTEGGAGFIPETFKWILTLDSLPENSSFDLHGLTYTVGKSEPLIYQDKVYGYRSSVSVKDS